MFPNPTKGNKASTPPAPRAPKPIAGNRATGDRPCAADHPGRLL